MSTRRRRGPDEHEGVPREVPASRPEPPVPAGNTAALSPAQVVWLQRTAGNAATQRALLQRDIKPGDRLPNLDQQLRTRVTTGVDAIAQAVPADVLFGRAQSELAHLNTTVDYLNLTQGPFRPEEVAAAKRFVQAAVNGARDYAGAKQIAQAAADLADVGASGDRQAAGPQFKSTRVLVDAFFATVESYAAQDQREGRINAEFDRLRGRQATKVLDAVARKAFSAALKGMRFVRLILQSPKRDPSDEQIAGSGVGKAAWKGAGNLQDAIREETAGLPRNKQFRTDIDNGKFRARVEEADRFIKLLVEPALLAGITCPSIVVHTKHSEFSLFSPSSWFDENTFRAYQSGNEVHVAHDDETAIIVHEVGHYLEKSLPLEVWSDIRALILQRHAAAGGGTQAVGGRGSSSEGGWKGEYPATGKYTSRAYSSGDTEVMSLTVEYLKRAGDTLAMIDKDPVQAAIVLRALRPADYASTPGLSDFDEYLPHAPAPEPALH